MANLVIKPASGSTNKLVLQNQAGTVDAITVEDSGSTTLAGTANALGTVTSGTLGSAVSFPAGHIVGYAIVTETYSAGTAGGTFASGGWRPRAINTIREDADFLTGVSGGLFTLIAGKYLIEWACTAFLVNHWKSRLFISGVGPQAHGLQLYGETDDDTVTVSSGSAIVTRVSSSPFGIDCYCNTTHNTDGFGRASNLDSTNSDYCIVKILKLT